jgi:acid phosphatase (class A)
MKRCLALFLALSLPALAANFLAPDAIDVVRLLPPPPAADSLVQRAELEVVLQLQAERTPAQVARAEHVETEDAFVFGADVLGAWFTPANLPRTADFLAKLRDDLQPINAATKQHFNRRRPPFLDARVQPCVKHPDTGSYPSGHAMRSAIWAGVLGALFPDQAAAFQARATETRWSRLLAGVHNPTDVEAGRVLGEAIAQELLKNPAVLQALDALRAEAAPHLHRKAA